VRGSRVAQPGRSRVRGSTAALGGVPNGAHTVRGGPTALPDLSLRSAPRATTTARAAGVARPATAGRAPAAGALPGTRTAVASGPPPAALRERRPGARADRGANRAPRRRHGARTRRAPRWLWRVRSLRLAPVVDRSLRGRAWVALVGLLLTGVVFLNVSLLELNSGIARTDARAADLRRENAVLRMRVARLGSSERIQRAAAGRGFVPARPGQVGYLRPHKGDAARAARALENWRASEPARPPGSGGGAAETPSVTGDAASPTGTGQTAAGRTGGLPGPGGTAATNPSGPKPNAGGGGTSSVGAGAAAASPGSSSGTP